MSFLKWSKTGPELAIGTAKGNLLLYNRDTKKMVAAPAEPLPLHLPTSPHPLPHVLP